MLSWHRARFRVFPLKTLTALSALMLFTGIAALTTAPGSSAAPYTAAIQPPVPVTSVTPPVPVVTATASLHAEHMAALAHQEHMAHLAYLAQQAQAASTSAPEVSHDTFSAAPSTPAPAPSTPAPAPSTPAPAPSTPAAPAVSGPLTTASVEALWEQAGGPAWAAPQAASIAYCESGYNPDAYNPSGATGLWQILGSVVPGNLDDPFVNAENAVAKFKNAGDTFAAWVCQ